jgi:type I restriction enzyme, S subunit
MMPVLTIGQHLAVGPLLDAVPGHWEVLRFKAVFERLEERNVDYAYPMASLKTTGEVVLRSTLGGRQEPDEKNLPKYLVTHVDDLVVNPMWLVGGAIGVSKIDGAVSPDYRVFRTRGRLLPKYAHYLLRSRPYRAQYVLYTRAQTTFDRRVQQDDLDNMPLLVPRLDEQQAIADYLDQETAEIDTLITEQQQLVEMLRERRIAVVRSAVSGIGSGGSIGDSNDWFGSLPEGWSAAPIRRHFSVVLGKMLNANKDDAEGVKAPYLAAGSIQPETLLQDEPKNMTFSAPELEHYSLRAGDVVVVEGGAGYGRSHYLRHDLPGWGFQNHVARLRSSTGLVDGLFATYCLKACLASGHIEANNRTATIPSLSRDVLGAIRIPVPPASEQRQVAKHLDEQTARIDTLIAESERLVELSQERRSALITAAVVGQIDV